MSDNKLYVVTGASGRTGGATARALLKAKKQVRVVVREAIKGQVWSDMGADVAIADLADVSTLSKAFAGAHAAYIVSPQQYERDDLFEQANVLAKTIAKAATKSGVSKLVALSSVGAEQPNNTGWIAMNRALELHLAETGLPVTFLRAAYFMENWQGMVQHALAQGELLSFLSPITRKLPMIATEDIGFIAAQALDEAWEGIRVMALEGPEPYSPNDVAECLENILGKAITRSDIPESVWSDMVAGFNFSSAAIEGFIRMTQGLNSGHIRFDEESDIVRRKGITSLSSVINTLINNG